MLGFLGVAAGAFGAHGLEDVLSAEMLAVFETGARYHLIHALAIVLLGVAEHRLPPLHARRAGLAFLFGVIVFSGSLYLLAVTGIQWIGVITPVGGLALLAGWAAFASAGWRAAREPTPGRGSGAWLGPVSARFDRHERPGPARLFQRVLELFQVRGRPVVTPVVTGTCSGIMP